MVWTPLVLPETASRKQAGWLAGRLAGGRFSVILPAVPGIALARLDSLIPSVLESFCVMGKKGGRMEREEGIGREGGRERGGDGDISGGGFGDRKSTRLNSSH